MNVLDLFSGIGGFSLGLGRAGFNTVAFCELDSYCQLVLRKHWPDVPIHTDIRELDGTQYRGAVDVVCGGWPCQTYSTAAHGNNVHPDMYPELERVIRTVRPRWVIAENVTAAPDIRGQLADCGYATSRWIFQLLFRGHVRERAYYLAHANGDSKSLCAVNEEASRILENAGFHWEPEPKSVGVDDGVSSRMDRLRVLGNAVVPQIPEILGRAIMATA